MTATTDGCATSTRPHAPILHDRRKTAYQAHGPAGKWKVSRRSIKKTTGICLHQTACVLGERPERWDSVGAHFGVMRSGAIVWLHDFTHVVAHGNAWNAQTIGIEVDGLFRGAEDDPSTVWDNPATAAHEQGMPLTPEQAASLDWLIRWICEQVAAQGGQIRVLVAHRQSSKTRRNDPGEAIWRATRPLAHELDLGFGGAGFEIGGLPIPGEWDETCEGTEY